MWPCGLSARESPLSVGFPSQEHWSGVPFSSPGDLLDPGIEPESPALAGGFLTTLPPGKPVSQIEKIKHQNVNSSRRLFLVIFISFVEHKGNDKDHLFLVRKKPTVSFYGDLCEQFWLLGWERVEETSQREGDRQGSEAVEGDWRLIRGPAGEGRQVLPWTPGNSCLLPRVLVGQVCHSQDTPLPTLGRPSPDVAGIFQREQVFVLMSDKYFCPFLFLPDTWNVWKEKRNVVNW